MKSQVKCVRRVERMDEARPPIQDKGRRRGRPRLETLLIVLKGHHQGRAEDWETVQVGRHRGGGGIV